MAEHLQLVDQQIVANLASLAKIQAEYDRAGPQAPEWMLVGWAKDKAFLQEQLTALQKQKLVLLEAHARSAAAGPGPGSAAASGVGAGARAAPVLLVDTAASLRPWPGHPDDSPWAWQLEYGSSGRKLLYLDSKGAVHIISGWARNALTASDDKWRRKPPGPLIISGHVKTGKSFTLEHMVPSAVAVAVRDFKGEGDMSKMMLLKLNASSLQREGGAAVMLQRLLSRLVDWVRKEGVPVQERELLAAEKMVAGPFDPKKPGEMGSAVRKLLKAVEVPVLVLCDEVQSLFLPTINGKLDALGAAYVRDVFMKHLLTDGPHSMLWCLTGSSMVLTWVSIAEMPPNGFTVIIGARSVDLPATYNEAQMQLLWEQLKERFADEKLNPQLQDLCPPSAAQLSITVEEWVNGGCPADVAAFVRNFNWNKLIEEARREWHVGLQRMPRKQRRALVDLANVAVGSVIHSELHPGLRRFLEPHLAKRADGRHFLKDSYQRQIVKLLFTKDGTLRRSWSDLEYSASLICLEGRSVISCLGEAADYLFGAQARRTERALPWGAQAFKEELQSMANELSCKLGNTEGGTVSPRELWGAQPWFKDVLLSRWNSKDYAWYNRVDSTLWLDSHLAMLVFFLRLSRNVLVHRKPWEKSYVEMDLRVIEALPRVLGWRLASFTDAITIMITKLSPDTIGKAAKEAAKEDEVQLPGGAGGGDSSGARGEPIHVEGANGTGGDLGGGPGSSSGSSGSASGRGYHAMPSRCTPAALIAVAGRGCPTLQQGYVACSRGKVWGQGRLLAAMRAPHLGVERAAFAQSTSAVLRLLRLLS